ncbi:MAG: 30S ribosomal protein S12 methylthiotransferase RimO [Bacteroidales bacterium]|nr:30S ribosomal protein S12 methylthiotransferase RimO [Bacteroidales bacterium]
MQSVNIITLGCSKNLVDSEHLARQLQAVGYKLVLDSEKFTDVVILNTCGFIHDAKEESIEAILNAVQAKNAGKIKKLYVMGCLSQRYADELRAEIPEVDSFFGARGIDDILQELQVEKKGEILHERLISTPKHLAYLKLAEGCNRTCAFCAIPSIRGKYVSESIETLVNEAKFLVSNGAKELSLIAQDLSFYGYDLYKKNALADLVAELQDINGLEWIRLHYLYPNSFPKEILDSMNQLSKICHYIDIPFQHASDKVLTKMRRYFSEKETFTLMEELKTKVPDIAIRTSLIVGHPGETDKEFQKLVDFVRQAEFDRLGVFTYSHEEGTYAGENYKDSIPEKVKNERQEIIMNLQQEISLKKNKEKVGKIFKVLIDRKESEGYVGRTQYDAFEVDNEVFIETEKLKVGDFYDVKITNADTYDLIGEVINN